MATGNIKIKVGTLYILLRLSIKDFLSDVGFKFFKKIK